MGSDLFQSYRNFSAFRDIKSDTLNRYRDTMNFWIERPELYLKTIINQLLWLEIIVSASKNGQ